VFVGMGLDFHQISCKTNTTLCVPTLFNWVVSDATISNRVACTHIHFCSTETIKKRYLSLLETRVNKQVFYRSMCCMIGLVFGHIYCYRAFKRDGCETTATGVSL
jgi:hypothetical protein